MLFVEFFEIQILEFFNRIGPLPTFVDGAAKVRCESSAMFKAKVCYCPVGRPNWDPLNITERKNNAALHVPSALHGRRN